MPWITINLMEGHSDEQKDKLFERVTAVVSETLELPKEYVRIQLVEMSPNNHSIAGRAIKHET
ncbi:MAG: 2-hydroxymuconate tautomerase family protein [Rhodospirillales bacterium]|nr:2-hydroxymuconate tautomerase family protein [Rhodospirillales bacterium]MCB9973691.1 2-hydroxymuconate tautomerase family protein [Rhodospirillales bacterium]